MKGRNIDSDQNGVIGWPLDSLNCRLAWTPWTLFSSFQQFTVNMFISYNFFCQWLDLNRGPLESETTALPTEPKPLPNVSNSVPIEITGSIIFYTRDQFLSYLSFDLLLCSNPSFSRKIFSSFRDSNPCISNDIYFEVVP